MHPHVGPVPAFLIGWSIAAVLGGGSVIWLMWRARLGAWQISVVFLALALSLVVGSKLLYLLEAWPRWFDSRMETLNAVFSERMRMPGGFLLAVAIGPPLARVIRIRYLQFADLVTPAAGLCIFGIRVGCYLAGCCYGTPAALPWAVRFPPASDVYQWQVQQHLISPSASATLPVHPLQLYFAVAGLVIFAGLTGYQGRKRYHGEILLLFALMFLWSTWLLELMRALPHDLTRRLVFAGGMVVTGVMVVIERRLRMERRRSVGSTQAAPAG